MPCIKGILSFLKYDLSAVENFSRCVQRYQADCHIFNERVYFNIDVL